MGRRCGVRRGAVCARRPRGRGRRRADRVRDPVPDRRVGGRRGGSAGTGRVGPVALADREFPGPFMENIRAAILTKSTKAKRKPVRKYRLHGHRSTPAQPPESMMTLCGHSEPASHRNGSVHAGPIIHFPQREPRRAPPVGLSLPLSFFSSGGSKDQKRKMALC